MNKTNLIKIISYDIYQQGIISLILLIIIIISAISIITLSYKTRLLITQKNLMSEIKESLDIEWRNLILEENVLTNHSRIEYFSKNQLHMIHVNSQKEYIIVIK